MFLLLRHHYLRCIFSFSLLFIIIGCDNHKRNSSKDASDDLDGGNLTDSDTIEVTDAGVIPGETGAVCQSADDCHSPLLCIDGKCQPEGCQLGILGCACGQGNTCVTDSTGNALQCVAGTCLFADCSAAGMTGCPCVNNISCISPDDVCQNGLCLSGNCSAGDEGCVCLAGTCKAGLFCRDNTVCVDSTGFAGGSCLSNGQCYRGARCDSALNQCVRCDLGSEGCQCTDYEGCNEGLACTAGICLGVSALPPANPKCYTPCNANLVIDAVTLTCDSDGLLPGCIGDFACTEGSCLAAGDIKPTCATDLDCPFFQTCLTGGCYSNCENTSDCSAGLGCFKKVCRIPCRSGMDASSCPDGTYCDASDGENGFCLPVGSPSDTPQEPPNGSFTLDQSVLEFSNISVSDQFQILSKSAVKQGFTVRKLSHTLYNADGSSERIDAPKDPATGEYVECDAAAGQCPLFWLDLGSLGATTREATISIEALPDCTEDSCPLITVGNAGGSPGVRWTGELEITSRNGRSVISLSYVERPEGQWVGDMYFFGNFPNKGIKDWLERDNRNDVTDVANGLIQRWGAFRSGNLTNGWEEFKAVLTSTRTGSWNYGEVKNKCDEVNGAGTSAVCYPFSNSAGVRTYVNDAQALPIPTGLSEFQMGMNLRLPSGDGSVLTGRIESSVAMHYAGNPAIHLTLSSNPAVNESCDPAIGTDCVVFVTGMEAEINVGGRYLTDAGGTCGVGYEKVQTPWLIEGFTQGTSMDPQTQTSYQYACMDSELPFDVSTDANLLPLNVSLAGGNPVPDGLPRLRTFRLIDGALINQTELFILFEERFESFVGNIGDSPGDKGISAYGYMILKKQPVDVKSEDLNEDGIPDAFKGNIPPPAIQKELSNRLGVTCDQRLLDNIGLGNPHLADDTEGSNVAGIVSVLLSGNGLSENVQASPLVSDGSDPNVVVHYYCEDTGLFDGGSEDIGGTEESAKIPCPAGSRIEFFVVKNPDLITQESVANESCQQDVVCEVYECTEEDCEVESYNRCTGGTCQQTLNSWRDNGLIEPWEPFSFCAVPCEDDPSSSCPDPYNSECDTYRLDLRRDRVFFSLPEGSNGKEMQTITAAISDAFRYKIRFRGRSGSQIGFAPEICIENSDEVPYCYEPELIEEIRNRVDCLISIYSDDTLYRDLESTNLALKGKLDSFLRESFSRDPTGTDDGFERLYAELLVMMGDESLTAAFASRFDLAAAGGANFEGSLFEVDGINLSGVAGFEMYSLYQAIQYYQMALDRLYRAGPDLTKSLERNASTDSPTNLISPETVEAYLERLIRASTQKARAVSEVAKNYQSFNRPDLARRVIERSYTSTYLESIILTRLMTDISKKSTSADRPQIQKTIEDGQRRYLMALLDMKEVYSSISDNINFFGFTPEYIPFPTINISSIYDVNAFESLLETAKSKMELAKQREIQALNSNRSYNVDSASFQRELATIQNNYESQLGELCGVFEAEDGRVYPAIKKYADLDPFATLLGDPCGHMTGGTIYTKIIELEDSLIGGRILSTRFDNLLTSISIEENRAKEQCDLIESIADFQFEQAGDIVDLQSAVRIARVLMNEARDKINLNTNYAQGMVCTPEPPSTMNPSGGLLECKDAWYKAQIGLGAETAKMAVTAAGEAFINAKEREIAEIDRNKAHWVTMQECTSLLIDSEARLADMLLEIKEIELEALRTEHQSSLLMTEIDRLLKEGKRLQAEQEETENLLINVVAAQNDPNVRIYKNDAVINADIAFTDAIRSAYRATKVFEYYTSQSYARRDQLFLIRMVTAGDYNLENYLIQLENAYYDFQEQFGNPDVRVMNLSLRDDIMKIPMLDENGNPLTQSDRIDKMRNRLSRVQMLDSNGYLSIPFRTTLDALSPLTRNHKIVHIEANMIGSRIGDTEGRLYIRQLGTGVIRNVEDEIDYCVFPERTGVIDPYFNGRKLFSPEVYKNFRFMDRPVVNTSWEMMINQRDEEVNKDIDLQSLTDIRLYVYYTDFTVF